MTGSASSPSLTSGSSWASIWRMSWPMVVIMLLNFLVGLTDIYVAGFIGPDVQAVVGFVSQLYFLSIIAANAVSIGTVALVARAVGAGALDEALTLARQSLSFGLLCSVCLSMAGLLFRRQILRLAGFPDEVFPIALDFFTIFSVSLVPNYLVIIANAVFRASGEVRKSLLSMGSISVLNMVLNFGLVFGFLGLGGYGYRGIALATAAAMTVGMLFCLFLLSRGSWKGLLNGPWRLDPGHVKRLLSLGWPALLYQVSWSSGSIVLYNILGRLGDARIPAMAALTNGLRIEAIIFLPAFALNMAASVLTGQNLGAGNPDRAEKIGWKTAGTGVLFVSLTALPFFLSPGTFAGIVAKDSAVFDETSRYLRMMMPSEPFMALGAILGGCLQGAGDTRGFMYLIVGSMWAIRLPLAYLLAITAGYGAGGVWAAMVVSMGVYGVAVALRYQRGKWKTLKP